MHVMLRISMLLIFYCFDEQHLMKPFFNQEHTTQTWIYNEQETIKNEIFELLLL